MAKRNVTGVCGDDLFEANLLLRIPCGEFAYDADMLDPFIEKMSADALCLQWIYTFNFNAAVVYITGQEVRILRDVEKRRVKPRSADDHHPYPVDLVLDDGIRGEGGAQDDSFELTDGIRIDKLRGDSEEGGQEIFFIGEDLGFFSYGNVVQENRIRVCAPHIYTQNHGPP
jgi:hypothetical protein